MIFILLLPAIILITLVFGYPLIRYIWLSLHSYSVLTDLQLVPNNLSNWIRLINDNRFWIDTFQTARFAFTSVTLELILALLVALLLNQRIKARGIVRSLALLPWALPTTIMALGWRWIFNAPYGAIESIASFLKIGPLNILANPNFAWQSTVLADVWKTTPFIALILLAGLQTIPDDLYEAFFLEGGSKIQAVIRITIPLLKPYLLLSILFRLAQAFGVFDLIQVMTGGGPAGSTESLAIYAYLNAMRFLDFGYSSTIMIASFILLTLTSIIGFYLINLLNPKEEF